MHSDDYNQPVMIARLFTYFDGTGVGIEVDYWGEGYYDRNSPHYKLGGSHVRYYSFAKCEHEYEERSKGNCLHQLTCNKCGFSYEVDSSD